MTNKEAIEILSNMVHDDIAVYGHKDKPNIKALNLAIKALEAFDKITDIVNEWGLDDEDTKYYCLIRKVLKEADNERRQNLQ